MMKKMAWVLALVGIVAASGCVDMQSEVKLKKDGSGTMTMTQYMSPQVAGMMESMTGMAGGDTNAVAQAKPDPLAMFGDMIEQEIKKMGEVKLVSKEAVTNAQGWKGFKLVCSFADIRKLNMQSGGEMGPNGSEAAEEPGKPAAQSVVEFTPASAGKKAVLVIREPDVKPAQSEAAPTEAGAPDPEAMMGMMAPMMAGMRMQMAIEVEGKIVKTNAKYVTGNKVTIADIQMDKVLANPEGRKLIAKSQSDPNAMNDLEKLNIEGVKVQRMKPLEIEFE